MSLKKREAKKSKTVAVREHPRRAPISNKNPNRITIVDRHLRHIDERILKRPASSDEVIQVYKGILGDKSETANRIMKNFRNFYEKLKL